MTQPLNLNYATPATFAAVAQAPYNVFHARGIMSGWKGDRLWRVYVHDGKFYFIKVGGSRQHRAAVDMRLDVVRLQRQRAIMVRERLIEPTQLVQREAAADQCVGIGGSQLQRGIVARNVALVAHAPRLRAIPKVEQRSWTSGELQAFLHAAAGHRLFAALWTAAFTGMRRNEVLALRW